MSQAQKTLQIGEVTLKSRYILAPMAGICNLPFRRLCAEKGAGMVSMEMVSAKAISYKNKKTMEMLRTHPSEHPVSLQLFGSEPDLMGEIAAFLNDYPVEVIDLNMGCPAPKIVKNGDGSALLKNPKLVEEIIKKVACASHKPVTVKIRIGFDDNHINAEEIANIAEGCGAAAITVHGRTREQYYSGKANWEIIGKIKRQRSIPIIANGDIRTAADVKACEEITGCDGFMIGRGAQGNPWIFEQLCQYEATGVLPDKPSIRDIADMMLVHARLLIETKGAVIGMQEMRKHAVWYLSGMRGAATMRRRMHELKTYEQLEQILEEIIRLKD